jgi:fatty-acid desaturase
MNRTKGTFRPVTFWSLVVLHVIMFYTFWYGWTYGVPGVAWVTFFAFYLYSNSGISLGYHRFYTHNAFKCKSWFEKHLAIAGAFAGEGRISSWVPKHHQHHAYEDDEWDPHSPNHGFLWSHFGWVCFRVKQPPGYKPRVFGSRNVIQWQARWYWVIVSLSSVVLPFLAGFGWSSFNGASGAHALGIGFMTMLLAGPTRILLHLHATWAVNSFGHTFGTTSFQRKKLNDRSRNCWPIMFFALDEFWHANHHAQSNCAYLGWKWYQPDIGKLILLIFRKLGVVTKVNVPSSV